MLGFGKSWEPIKDIPDLTGKVAIVTGGKLVRFITHLPCISLTKSL
jgi:hypothetical protein